MKPSFDLGTLARSLCVASLIAFHAPQASAAVTAAIMPSTVVVYPGAEFEVTLEVTLAGSPFNAFSSIVDYDPAALTPVAIVPLMNQVGTAMQAQQALCGGSPFNDFTILPSTVEIDFSLICNGAAMTGPGAYYRLRFRASETLQQTAIDFTKMEFILAGNQVTPSTATGALVVIAVPVELSQFSID